MIKGRLIRFLFGRHQYIKAQFLLGQFQQAGTLFLAVARLFKITLEVENSGRVAVEPIVTDAGIQRGRSG